MRVENVYPAYKNGQEREKTVQEVYTDLQLIFYNERRGKKKVRNAEQIGRGKQ